MGNIVEVPGDPLCSLLTDVRGYIVYKLIDYLPHLNDDEILGDTLVKIDAESSEQRNSVEVLIDDVLFLIRIYALFPVNCEVVIIVATPCDTQHECRRVKDQDQYESVALLLVHVEIDVVAKGRQHQQK